MMTSQPSPDAANPYAAPQTPGSLQPGVAEGPDAIPLEAALYTSGQVSLATFLGSPLGGAVLMAINEHRARRSGGAVKALLAGVVGTAILLGIGAILPNGVPTFPIALISLVAMGSIARQTQGPFVQLHLARGGRRASGWGAAGIGLLSMIVVMVPIVTVIVASEMANGSGQ